MQLWQGRSDENRLRQHYVNVRKGGISSTNLLAETSSLSLWWRPIVRAQRGDWNRKGLTLQASNSALIALIASAVVGLTVWRSMKKAEDQGEAGSGRGEFGGDNAQRNEEPNCSHIGPNESINPHPNRPPAAGERRQTDRTFRISDPDMSKWTKALVVWTAALVFTALGSDIFQGLQWSELQEADIESGRAWIGPRSASSDQIPEAGKPLKIMVDYYNSGRSPGLHFRLTSDWLTFDASNPVESSNTSARVLQWAHNCMADQTKSGGMTVFPTSGFAAYNMTDTIEKGKITDTMQAEKGTFVHLACFVYVSSNIVRHSSFCFFFQNKMTDAKSWSFCPGGNEAD